MTVASRSYEAGGGDGSIQVHSEGKAAPQAAVGLSPEVAHLNLLAETNRMVYGSKRLHVCSG